MIDVFFVSGMIEAWGRGFDKIKTACDALFETPMPEYNISDNGIMVHCVANEQYLILMRKDRLGIDEPIMSRLWADYEPICLVLTWLHDNWKA